MDQQIDTIPLQDEQGRLIGYACEGVENDASVHEAATSFFFGLRYPIGQQALAMEYINDALLENVAEEYGLLSGSACNVLNENNITPRSQDQQSALVSIQSNVNRVQLFQSCNENSYFDPNLQECQTLQLILKGLVWNAVEMPDVLQHVESWLQQEIEPYKVTFLGGQELEDYTIISTGADRPSYPAQQGKQEFQTSSNRNYVGLYKMSPLGIAFCVLLVVAFCGLVLACLRKQKLVRVRHEQKKKHKEKEEKDEEEVEEPKVEIFVPEIDRESSSSSPSSSNNSADLSVPGSNASAVSA